MAKKSKVEKENVKKEVDATNQEGVKKARKKRSNIPLFASAISSIKKETPETGLSSASVFLLSSLASVVMDRIIDTSSRLAKYEGKNTLKMKHSETAANLVLVGPMASHANILGRKAVIKFVSPV